MTVSPWTIGRVRNGVRSRYSDRSRSLTIADGFSFSAEPAASSSIYSWLMQRSVGLRLNSVDLGRQHPTRERRRPALAGAITSTGLHYAARDCSLFAAAPPVIPADLTAVWFKRHKSPCALFVYMLRSSSMCSATCLTSGPFCLAKAEGAWVPKQTDLPSAY